MGRRDATEKINRGSFVTSVEVQITTREIAQGRNANVINREEEGEEEEEEEKE